MSKPEPPLTRRWRDLPLHDFTDARCVGKWWLFDSTDPSDHREAAELCAECPARAGCADLLVNVAVSSGQSRAGGGPSGTWAGRLIGRAGERRLAC